MRLSEVWPTEVSPSTPLKAMTQIRTAQLSEFERVVAFYRYNDYLPEIRRDDVIVVAEHAGVLCAAVRLCDEHGVLLLRGMRVAQAVQRRGIGTELLEAAAALIGGRECYCISHRYLCRFYGHVAFEEMEPHRAPSFLKQRLAEYRREHDLDVIIMRRPPGS
jgi:N-acetylglutamate synthase-like GNAT family acetyltransferase